LSLTVGNILLDSQHRRLVVNNLTLSVTDNGQYDVGYTKQSLPTSLVPPEVLWFVFLIITIRAFSCLAVVTITGVRGVNIDLYLTLYVVTLMALHLWRLAKRVLSCATSTATWDL
jgi:hypothetical protein